MAVEFIGMEIDLPRPAGGVAHRLVDEMERRRIAALPADLDRVGPDSRPELDQGDEAVAAGAVPALAAIPGRRSERRERAEIAGGETDWITVGLVVERNVDRP